ncbi:retrovirus-related pol polyprotein from transposon TNT 1-94 [Tanacetum coccineum]|uniref:Retrovirus-related pol polyprotein from transposon TNT 1-94 n=1 Tax=Tanacetum coccineum TaxID=301880 RepID=A0ABQ5IPJ3_9ASTR
MKDPFDTRDTKIATLRLKFNAFKALEGEKVQGTFTRLKILLNDLENKGVFIPQAEVNVTFVNSLPRKWLSMNQTQRANNSIKNDSLATLFGKYNYEESLIDQIYESETQRFTIQSSTSKALISNTCIQDSDSDVEEDTMSRTRKPMDKSNETCFACGKQGHFQKDCPTTKTSSPSYPSSNKSYNKPKFQSNSSQQHNQNNKNTQKDYRGKYKALKSELAILTKKIDAMSKNKSEKGLIEYLMLDTKPYNYQEVNYEEVWIAPYAKIVPVITKLDVYFKGPTDAARVKLLYEPAFPSLYQQPTYFGFNDHHSDELAKAFRVFSIRRQEMEETYHVTFSENDEAITQSSIEDDEINFNEKKSFPDDEFLVQRSKSPISSRKEDYFPYVLAFDLSTNNITIPDLISPTTQDINSPDESPKFSIADDHPVHHEPDDFKPAKIYTEVIHDIPAPQDRWSREKHILLVNILGEPQAGVTTRSRVRDSEAASAHECLYLADCASVKCPMLPPNNLSPDESGVSVNGTRFGGMIRSLMYITASRPDIQFSTCLCARYQDNAKESHLVAVKRIFKYLKGTPNLGLWYPKGLGFDLKAYSDSDYAGCNLDRKSTSGGCQILGGKLVCWSAKKQNSVAMSSTEAEYVAAARYHFIRDHVLKGDIELHFIPNDLQLADIFTKPLAKPSFTRLVDELGILNIEKVDGATNTITFTLSNFDKPLLFNLDEFSSITGLYYSENHVSAPAKETVRAGLATLGLVDEKNPDLSFAALVNSSLLKIKYFHRFMLYVVKCLGGMQGSHDQLNINQQMIAYSLIWGLNVDIGNIIFSNLVFKLQNGKKGREPNGIQPKKTSMRLSMPKKLVATADATKSLEAFGLEHEKIVKEVVEDPLANESGIGSLGNEANSDLESMSDDEIMFVSGNEEEDDDFKKLSQVDEIAVDNVIDKLVGMANTEDATTNVCIASDLHAHTSVVRDTLPTFKKQIQKAINKKMPKVVLKPLYIEFNALNKLESERFVILQKQLSKSIKKTMAKAVKKNVSLEKIAANLHELVGLVSQLVRIVDLVAPPISAATEGEKESQAQAQSELEPAMEKPKVVIDIPIPAPTPLNSIIDNIPYEQFTINLFSSGSSEFSPTPPPSMVDKGKGIAQTSDDDQQKLLSYMEGGGLTPTLLNLHQFRIAGEGPLTLEEAKLQMQEIKRLADLKAEKEKSEKSSKS